MLDSTSKYKERKLKLYSADNRLETDLEIAKRLQLA
jgi:hypothetical protein